MGEWLIGETDLLGLAVQNWLLAAIGVFAIYGIALGVWSLRPQRPR